MSIAASAERVRSFLADPANLPRWAVRFARSVRHDGRQWLVTTGAGDVPVTVVTDPGTGIVDFHMFPGQDREAVAACRVLRRAEGAEVVFTQVQTPGMPDEAFVENVSAAEHELAVLKRLLEGEGQR